MTTRYPCQGGNTRSQLLRALIAYACGAATGVGHAADASPEQAVLSEVVVTAQKREQSLQDVPISITALTGDVVAQRGIQNFGDIARNVPSMSYIEVGPSQGQLSMRGAAVSAVAQDEPQKKESVGIYFDETPVGVARFSPLPRLFDVDRIEVLRGPQGTLYGAGSLAGTVRFIFNRPDPDAVDAGFEVSAASVDRGGLDQGYDAMLNVPIVDGEVAARVVGYYQENAGFIDNVALGRKEVNDSRQTGGRAALSWDISDQFSLMAKFLHQSTEAGGVPSRDLSQPDPQFDPDRMGKFDQYRETAEPLSDDMNLVNLVASYDFGRASLLSSTSRVDRDVEFTTDLSSILDVFFGLDLVAPLYDRTKIEDFSQELRLVSSGDSRLEWIVGGFYQKQEKDYGQTHVAPGIDAELGVAGGSYGYFDTLLASEFELEERQVALFGELTYALTDRIKATVGARWFEVDQDFVGFVGGLFGDGQPVREREASSDDVNPKFLIAFEATPQLLLSLQAARGFRIGGINDIVPLDFCSQDLADAGYPDGAPISFEPENAWNYELGMKSSWSQGRTTLNAAVFELDYENVQVTRRLNCGWGFTENVPDKSARSRGVELEFATSIGDFTQFSIGGSYVDAQLTEDFDAGAGILAGDRLPLSPEFSMNASFRRLIPLANGLEGHIQLDYQHVGDVVQALGYEANPALVQPTDSYDLGHLRVGISRNNWTIELFADNLFNSEVVVGGASLFGGATLTETMIRPRTVGILLRAGL